MLVLLDLILLGSNTLGMDSHMFCHGHGQNLLATMYMYYKPVSELTIGMPQVPVGTGGVLSAVGQQRRRVRGRRRLRWRRNINS